jgi:glycosyltransferase involved in cell wall biosynthesis
MTESKVKKILAAISRYGFRAGIQNAVARWAYSELKVPQDVWGDYSWILKTDRPATNRPPANGPLHINWLIPDVIEASGGLLNVLRAIYHLEKWGHRHRIYVMDKAVTDSQEITNFVRQRYFPITTEIEVFRGQVVDSDALVATHWSTAYAARALSNTAGKFYFVQDLEYLFYAAGSFCEFVKQTYQWGFRGITLGPWIADMLRREFQMPCTPFGFSYDHDIYTLQGPRHFSEDRRRVLFYARPRTERRGFELGILALSLVAEKRPDVDFILVGFPPKSINLPFRATMPGVLPPRDLAALYRSCSLALVLSYTNLSLLPLELMACGCAVVSNRGSNVEWLLTEQTSQLTDSNPEALAEGILALLDNDSERVNKITAGRKLAGATDWVSEIRTIEAAFYAGLQMTREQAQFVGLS